MRAQQRVYLLSDNLRQYRAIRDALTRGYSGGPQGQFAWHLDIFAALISGIVARKNIQLPNMASQVPSGIGAESRVKRFAQWVSNDTITEQRYCVPCADVLLVHLALQTLVLVLDGNIVGRESVPLMLHVAYKGRALPLVWQARKGKKRHIPRSPYIIIWTAKSIR